MSFPHPWSWHLTYQTSAQDQCQLRGFTSCYRKWGHTLRCIRKGFPPPNLSTWCCPNLPHFNSTPTQFHRFTTTILRDVDTPPSFSPSPNLRQVTICASSPWRKSLCSRPPLGVRKNKRLGVKTRNVVRCFQAMCMQCLWMWRSGCQFDNGIVKTQSLVVSDFSNPKNQYEWWKLTLTHSLERLRILTLTNPLLQGQQSKVKELWESKPAKAESTVSFEKQHEKSRSKRAKSTNQHTSANNRTWPPKPSPPFGQLFWGCPFLTQGVTSFYRGLSDDQKIWQLPQGLPMDQLRWNSPCRLKLDSFHN